MSAVVVDAQAHATEPERAGPATDAVVGHLLGDPGAPVRVITYGTFGCLRCRRAWPALRTLAAFVGDIPLEL